jgi:hypothetical protein
MSVASGKEIILYRGNTTWPFSDEDTQTTDHQYDIKKLILNIFYIHDTVIEIFQSEIAFASPSSPKPVLASYGAGPCVIIGGYDKVHKIGFIAHFSHEGEVFIGALAIREKLQKMLAGRKGDFEVVLKGGITSDSLSQRTIVQVTSFLERFRETKLGFSLNLVSTDFLESHDDASKSLCIDTRNGTIREYDPLVHNPFHYRKLSPRDIEWARDSFEHSPRLKDLTEEI